MKLYIVTNIAGGENYTPSVMIDKIEAYNWFKSLASENIYLSHEADFQKLDIDKSDVDIILSKAESVCNGSVEIYEDKIIIQYSDSEQVIQIFEIDI